MDTAVKGAKRATTFMSSMAESWGADKHPASTSALMASLHNLRETNPKAVRSTVHVYPASVYAADQWSTASGSSTQLPDRRITSWKMTEHMYRQSNNPFPTLARGLFTENVERDSEVPAESRAVEGQWEEGQQRERIVARGYDKFFNIDEVEWTNWSHMKNHSLPPYYLTLKSNGCLILVSALSPTHLLVASKHSLGTTTENQENQADSSLVTSVEEGMEKMRLSAKAKGKAKDTGSEEEESSATAHAEMGRKWVRKSLRAAGKSEADLAARLWRENLSAVLELCDDSFEEHVIATPAHLTGLHLHGLNRNTPHFSTLPPSEVASFATEFGFIPTKYTQLDTLDDVKAFTDKVEQDQSWEGDMIEGFVVRSMVAESSSDVGSRPPYLPGAPFFFKVKFNEPYLLYRQWREVTRVMLSFRVKLAETKPSPETVPLTSKKKGKPQTSPETDMWAKVRKKTQRPEVAVYADWCFDSMRSDPALFDDYDRGVVRVRERFLAWTEAEGKLAWQEAKSGKYKLKAGSTSKSRDKVASASVTAGDASVVKKDKWLIVPIAIPGCGKTLIGIALSKLFGFGHTQSDDVTTKKTAPTFLNNIANLFKTVDVVYADRNNHIDKHYNELAEPPDNNHLSAFRYRLVGVVWNVSAPPYHRVLRICSDRVVSRGENHRTLRPDTNGGEHEAVVGQFLRNWTPPDPTMFENLISVEVEDDPKTALVKIIDGLVETMGLQKPSAEAIDDALKAGERYKITGSYQPPKHQFAKPIRYYALAPELNTRQLMEQILAGSDVPSARELYDVFVAKKRIIENAHVTICHETEVAREKETPRASTLQTLWGQCQDLAKQGIPYRFEITHLIWDDRVMCLSLRLAGTANTKHLDIPETIQRQLHITIGTISEEVRTMESIKLVRAMREAVDEEMTEAKEVAEEGGQIRWISLESIEGEGRVRGMW